jgi:hypothetical protein
MPGRTVGDWLRTDGYERAGQQAARAPGTVELVEVDDIRQALAWLCGRTASPATCELAHRAGSARLGEVRPHAPMSVAPTAGPR